MYKAKVLPIFKVAMVGVQARSGGRSDRVADALSESGIPACIAAFASGPP